MPSWSLAVRREIKLELHIVTCHTIKDNEHVPAAEMPEKLRECRELAVKLLTTD